MVLILFIETSSNYLFVSFDVTREYESYREPSGFSRFFE